MTIDVLVEGLPLSPTKFFGIENYSRAMEGYGILTKGHTNQGLIVRYGRKYIVMVA